MTDSSDNQVAAESGTEGRQTSTTVPVAAIFANPGGSTTDSSSTSSAPVIGVEAVSIRTQKINSGEGSEGAQGSTGENSAVRIPSNYVTPEVIINVTTSAANFSPSPPSSSTVYSSSTPDTVVISIIQGIDDRLTSSLASSVDIDSVSTTANIDSTETTPEMSGNSSRSSSGSSSGPPNNNASTSSSSRRQRNGLFGINLDLNFDPSSWLVPSNVAGRSISSLSVLPDWVRHPASMIPNRSGGDTHSSPGISAGEGRQSQQPHYLHQHYGPGTGTASRMVSHHQPSHQSTGTGGAERTNWGSSSSSFQPSSSNPSNMHQHHHQQLHSTPRTRHINTMRSVDEDLDAGILEILSLIFIHTWD